MVRLSLATCMSIASSFVKGVRGYAVFIGMHGCKIHLSKESWEHK
jgi:hypothetical protein